MASAQADYLELRRGANIRYDPSSDSPVLTRGEPGDRFEILDGGRQVNGYYRIGLSSGDEGWVYRTLGRRHPGAMPRPETGEPVSPDPRRDDFSIPPTPDLAPEDTLVVASWNIKWFGQKTPEKYDFVAMADFVEECDIVAIQELRGRNHRECIQALVELVNTRSDDRFLYRISEFTGYADNPIEGRNDYTEAFAFIWNRDRVRLVAEPVLADAPATNHPVFRQVPFVADFESLHENGFDFRVLTTHTVYNAGINTVRRDEVVWIRDWVLGEPGDPERDLVAIGDFNADPPRQSSAHWFTQFVRGQPGMRVLLDESERSGETPIRTTTPTKAISEYANPARAAREPVYDHVLVSEHMSDALPAEEMTRVAGLVGVHEFDNDPWWSSRGWSRAEVIGAVSDHRPIWFKIRYDAEDRDADLVPASD